MSSFLKEAGLKFLVSPSVIASFILSVLGLILLRFIHINYLFLVIIIGFSYYVFSTLRVSTKLMCGKQRFPKKSVRNLIIVALIFIFSLIPTLISTYFYSSIYTSNEFQQIKEVSSEVSTDVFPEKDASGIVSIPIDTAVVALFFSLIFIFDLLLPVFVFLLIKFTSIFATFYRKRKINYAKKKIKQIEKLKIVGITGSYGKTTTKELTHLILKKKFKVYSTPANVNSDIGVANTILSNMSFIVDVFIVEMGAYKRNEIKKICDIVSPDISVITAISNQHLALFKSIENTLKSKYEVVENAKDDAIVVLNGDNDLTLRIAGKSSKKEILYSTKKEMDIYATDIKSREDALEFNVHYKDKVQRFEVKILGEYNVSNILAATSVCLSLGMKLSEIAKALKEGSKTKHVGKLRKKISKFGYRVLDDSYNSNYVGFSAALDVLDKMKGEKKILVTIGIIELGSQRASVYKDLAKKISDVCDVLVTSDNKLKKEVEKATDNVEIVFDNGIHKQLKYLKNEVSSNDIVLFEGPNLRLVQEIVK